MSVRPDGMTRQAPVQSLPPAPNADSIHTLAWPKTELYKFTARMVLFAAAAETGFPVEEIIGLSQGRRVVMVRQCVCYIARTRTRASLPRIGNLVHRDHSTVSHAVQLVGKDWPRFGAMVKAIIARLEG